jgi:hypothetical protein
LADEVAVIYDLIEKTESDIDKFLKAFQISCVEDMPASSFDKAFNALQRKVKK